MVCLLALAMRLGHCAHELPLIRTHHLRLREVFVQRLPHQLLGRLALGSRDLLPVPCEGARFGRPVGHRPYDRLGRRVPIGGRIDAVAVLGDYAEVGLTLVFFRNWETQDMF